MDTCVYIVYLIKIAAMSKTDKKEISEQTSSLVNKNIDNQQDIYRNNQRVYNRIVEQNTESLEQAFDESKKSIDESIREARNQIPRYTETVNQVQEQTLQATKDIAENYLEYQKQTIDSFQSVFTPYIQNVNNQLLNNQDYYRRMPEMYSKLVNNYAENTIAMSRIFNDMAFSNMELFKNVVDNTKKQSKHLAEIGKRNVSTYERIERDSNDALLSTQKDHPSKN
jgi:ribosomal protein L20